MSKALNISLIQLSDKVFDKNNESNFLWNQILCLIGSFKKPGIEVGFLPLSIHLSLYRVKWSAFSNNVIITSTDQCNSDRKRINALEMKRDGIVLTPSRHHPAIQFSWHQSFHQNPRGRAERPTGMTHFRLQARGPALPRTGCRRRALPSPEMAGPQFQPRAVWLAFPATSPHREAPPGPPGDTSLALLSLRKFQGFLKLSPRNWFQSSDIFFLYHKYQLKNHLKLVKAKYEIN